MKLWVQVLALKKKKINAHLKGKIIVIFVYHYSENFTNLEAQGDIFIFPYYPGT